MREIKFKVIHNNKVIGIERLLESGWQWMCYELNPDDGERWLYGVFPKYEEYKRIQFTGVCDKNGEEIYQGDIISTYFKKTSDYDFYIEVGVVEIGQNLFQKTVIADKIHDKNNGIYSHSEVIGNIYENTELLK